MTRTRAGRVVAGLTALVATATLAQERDAASPGSSFTVVEASIAEMQRAMEQGRVSSRQLVEQSLIRVALYEDQLNAVVRMNRSALDEADVRDRERATGRVRGLLHGVPVALKDNIHTLDMPTTGGALAFAGFVPPYEATVTRNLREAGAVIIAKTQLTELANWVATGMPGNYNSLTGFGFNPYDPRRDPRTSRADGRPSLSTGGSSSGAGTAASFWAANVGTETSGSILNPSNRSMLVGIKPTVGRISRYGIIPITADQDTAGPMARTVADAAAMLGAMEGAAPDANDAATGRCEAPPGGDYTRFLNGDGLSGARIGVPRAFFYDAVTPAGANEPRGGLTLARRQAVEGAIAVLRQQGATIIDPVEIPSVVDPDRQRNFLVWNICAGVENRRGSDTGCSVVLKYGMKRDFNAWLATLGPAAPVRTLADLRAWNEEHRAAGTLKYDQASLDVSDEVDLETDRPRYLGDRARDVFLSGPHGIDAAIQAQQLDALLFPGIAGAGLSARAGYPTVAVPFTLIPNDPTPQFPGGFDARPMPYGVSFAGSACAEPRLIEIAYAFEQASLGRVPPPLMP